MDVLSYGGGVQSVALCVLAVRGVLPRPAHIVIADTGREARSTWEYLDAHLAPYLAGHDLAVGVVGHDLAKVDLWGKNGDLLLPAFTARGKLPTFCSTEWKGRVVRRYLRALGVERARLWIGFSLDEADRRKHSKEDEGWATRVYPLLDLMLSRADCEAIIDGAGLPLPVKSACHMCPHRTNSEWRHIRDNYPEQWQEALAIDAEIREADPLEDVFLHASRVPLMVADIDTGPERPADRQCGFGFCFI